MMLWILSYFSFRIYVERGEGFLSFLKRLQAFKEEIDAEDRT